MAIQIYSYFAPRFYYSGHPENKLLGTQRRNFYATKEKAQGFALSLFFLLALPKPFISNSLKFFNRQTN
jgi:hypothetical protein